MDPGGVVFENQKETNETIDAAFPVNFDALLEQQYQDRTNPSHGKQSMMIDIKYDASEIKIMKIDYHSE